MAKAVVTGTVRIGVQYGSGRAKVTAGPIYDFSWPCHFLLALSWQWVMRWMEWETCFLAEVFFFKSSFLSTIFSLVVERGLLFHLFGLVASFFSALVLLHFHLVYDI